MATLNQSDILSKLRILAMSATINTTNWRVWLCDSTQLLAIASMVLQLSPWSQHINMNSWISQSRQKILQSRTIYTNRSSIYFLHLLPYQISGSYIKCSCCRINTGIPHGRHVRFTDGGEMCNAGLLSVFGSAGNFDKIWFACGNNGIQYTKWKMNKLTYNLHV